MARSDSKEILGALRIDTGKPFTLQIDQARGNAEPVRILEGPERPYDGRKMREEYGLPMNDRQYDAVKDVQKQYQERASNYLTNANAELAKEVAARRAQINAIPAPKIPGFKSPDEVTIWAGGDGDKPTAYRVPKESAQKILDAMTESGYYYYKQHGDGSYGLAFRRYGKEGYEAMNEVQQAYNESLKNAQARYNAQKKQVLANHNKQIKQAHAALNESERGAKERINDQYNHLAGMFGNEMNELVQDWQKKKADNSASIQQLVDSGVLRRKVGVVR